MRARRVLFTALTLSLAAACGDDDEAAITTTTAEAPATTAAAEPFTILVSNDDGVGAEGIDALVQALVADPTIEVVVVAPAENQSGSGDATTPGGAPASDATTISGHAAVAVAGEPADSVLHGLDVVLADDPPDLVISGINHGQNLGPVVDVSGTVGAARTAARRGIPAVAVSQGLAPEGSGFDFAAGVHVLLDWLAEHRDRLAPGSFANINVPSCGPDAEIRGVIEVASAVDESNGPAIGVADCSSTVVDPGDDVAGFNAGYVTITEPGLGG